MTYFETLSRESILNATRWSTIDADDIQNHPPFLDIFDKDGQETYIANSGLR
jgi:hypothetical protein